MAASRTTRCSFRLNEASLAPPAKIAGEAVKGALFDAPDWDGLQKYWRANLTTLAAEFVAGHAVVSKHGFCS